MGIQGLIPFLEKASQPVNISQFSGCTVVVDAYCWLHKGAFACAEKLARGDQCTQYVTYCMKYVNMLLHHNIKPILVFDGCHLSAKAETEKKRRESRELNRRKAAELLRLDRANEAKTYLRRCVDVTHEMALSLIQECRARNVDCIVAPYEADAQLAYFSINDIADIVITEDSDLLLFGCKKVLFKMDLNGGGLLVDQKKLHLAMGIREDSFSLDKFRYMCILSGCDYLPSLPGIGLAKACRFITRSIDPDIHKALTRLPIHLNMPTLSVSPEYRDKFKEADSVFRYQPVFNPFLRKVVPLTNPPEGVSIPQLWKPLPEHQAEQLAFGNLDPFTLKQMDSWSPSEEKAQLKQSSNWSGRATHKSIWSPNFLEFSHKLKENNENKKKNAGAFVIDIPSTLGKKVVQKSQTTPQKRTADEIEDRMKELSQMYGVTVSPLKKLCSEEDVLGRKSEKDPSSEKNSKSSLQIPFKKSEIKSPPSLESGLLKVSGKSRKTVIDDSCQVVSSYFSDSLKTETSEEDEELRDRKSNDCTNSGGRKDVKNLKDTSKAMEDLLAVYSRRPLTDIKNTSPAASPEKSSNASPHNASSPKSPELLIRKFSNPFAIKKLVLPKDENESLLDSFDKKKNEKLNISDDIVNDSSSIKEFKTSNDSIYNKLNESKDDNSFDDINRRKELYASRDDYNSNVAEIETSVKSIRNNNSMEAQEIKVTSNIVNKSPRKTEGTGNSKVLSPKLGSNGNFSWKRKFDKFRNFNTLKNSPTASQEYKSPIQTKVSISSLENCNEEMVDDPAPIDSANELFQISSQESDEGFCSPSLDVKPETELKVKTPKQMLQSSSSKPKSQCRQVGLRKKSPAVGLKQNLLSNFFFVGKPKLNSKECNH